MSAAALARYYDRLARWNALARLVGRDGGSGQLTVHRALADPRHGGRPTTTRLHDLLAAHLPEMRSPRILDAGCGLGGTMIDLVRRLDGTAHGLTLSAAQAEIGRAAVRRHDLDARIRIELRDYDTPPAGAFDLVVAIESLAHSRDPRASLAAWAQVLAPRGIVALVDDMPRACVPSDPDFAAFTSGWDCPALLGHAACRAAMAALDLEIVHDIDLSDQLPARAAIALRLLDGANRAAARLVPSAAWRAVMASHRGGLALERLYRRGAMSYRLIIGRRR